MGVITGSVIILKRREDGHNNEENHPDQIIVSYTHTSNSEEHTAYIFRFETCAVMNWLCGQTKWTLRVRKWTLYQNKWERCKRVYPPAWLHVVTA
jgi:hypothetical protein